MTITNNLRRVSRGWWSENTLILTASVGMGHNSAAAALTEAMLQAEPAASAPASLDITALMRPWVRRIYRDGYEGAARYTPSILGTLFKVTNSARSIGGPTLSFDERILKDLAAGLIERQTPLIISTHFLASRVVGALKARGVLASRLVQVVTDFDAHAFWAVPETEHFCVAGAPARQSLIRYGIDPSRITITGLPINRNFLSLPNKEAARRELSLPENKPIFLLTLGGLGAAPYGAILSELLKIKRDLHVVVVCGKSESAYEEAARVLSSSCARQLDNGPTFDLHRFTADMPTLMAASDALIGKPGGLTSSEALAAGLPMVLVRPIPGQEERNRDYLLALGAAIDCRDTRQLAPVIEELLDNPGELAKRSKIALAASTPHAAAECLRLAADCVSLDSYDAAA